MTSVIQDFFINQLKITDEVILQKVISLAEIQRLPKGTHVFREGETPSHLAFLLKGILRGFLVDINGKDVTDCFCFQYGEPIVPSIPVDSPALISVETLTESEVLCLPMKEISEWLKDLPALIYIYNELLQDALRRHFEMKNVLHQCTAMQRYCWFLSRYAAIAERVSGKHIASFLNITIVTLSRLRREMREQRLR